MMHVQLPDRENISLSEAVTAFVYGAPRDLSSGSFYPDPAADTLLEQLHEAAHVGSVKFRALRAGSNKYQEIDPEYFGLRRYFDWQRCQILSWAPCDEGEYDEELVREWHNVHLDQEQFASFLNAMGVLVNQGQGKDSGSLEINRTGGPGRPSSRHHVEPMALSRLDAGDYPETLAEFCRQLAEWLKAEHPKAPRMTPRAIENFIRSAWNSRRTK
jgi:hypothetical protein